MELVLKLTPRGKTSRAFGFAVVAWFHLLRASESRESTHGKSQSPTRRIIQFLNHRGNRDESTKSKRAYRNPGVEFVDNPYGYRTRNFRRDGRLWEGCLERAGRLDLHRAKPSAMNRTFARVFQIYVFAYAFFFASRPLDDADFWWHLKTGQYIVDNGIIPTTDFFSFTNYGKAWVAHEWLSEVDRKSVV